MEKLKTLEEIKEQFATKSKDEIIEMFYNSSKTALELEVKNKDLQKSVEQIYEDYQDIGKMFFDLDEKVQNIIKQIQQAIDFAKTAKSIIGKTQTECLGNVLKILKEAKNE